MNRLTGKFALLLLLLPYTALVFGSQFLHTCLPHPSAQTVHMTGETHPQVTVERAHAHHGDCAACIWSGNCAEGPTAAYHAVSQPAADPLTGAPMPAYKNNTPLSHPGRAPPTA